MRKVMVQISSFPTWGGYRDSILGKKKLEIAREAVTGLYRVVHNERNRCDSKGNL